MTPYQVFAHEVKKGAQPSFRSAWFDFQTWERCRYFRDDPDVASREELDWIRSLDELAVALEGFQPGLARENCQNALEAVFVAFARMEHPESLCNAIRQWQAFRNAEQQTEKAEIGQQQ